ncbi:MAG: flagellar basal-body rod protein FlgG [Kiritimatiellae bacterium]|nr:flagellar basal-body rod protein FlgG [Kiritimatiellia bacterium]
MQRALWSAATGLRAQEMMMDTIANNLANVNTAGFKRSRTNFQDLLYTALAVPGSSSGDTEIPAGIQIGHGSRVVGVSKMHLQGSLKETGGELDMAIEGEGFFEITMPDGTAAYTRDGSFRMTAAGEIVTTDGYPVTGLDTIDEGTTDVTIAPDGSFSTVVDGNIVEKTRITLVRFANPEGLRSIGRNLFQATEASGAPQAGNNPGEGGTGTLAHRYLEASNVRVAEELVDMIISQRAFEANSKAIKASDEMLGIANSVRR